MLCFRCFKLFTFEFLYPFEQDLLGLAYCSRTFIADVTVLLKTNKGLFVFVIQEIIVLLIINFCCLLYRLFHCGRHIPLFITTLWRRISWKSFHSSFFSCCSVNQRSNFRVVRTLKRSRTYFIFVHTTCCVDVIIVVIADVGQQQQQQHQVRWQRHDVFRLHTGASGMRVRGTAERRPRWPSVMLPRLASRLPTSASERKRAQSESGCSYARARLSRTLSHSRSASVLAD